MKRDNDLTDQKLQQQTANWMSNREGWMTPNELAKPYEHTDCPERNCANSHGACTHYVCKACVFEEGLEYAEAREQAADPFLVHWDEESKVYVGSWNGTFMQAQTAEICRKALIEALILRSSVLAERKIKEAEQAAAREMREAIKDCLLWLDRKDNSSPWYLIRPEDVKRFRLAIGQTPLPTHALDIALLEARLEEAKWWSLHDTPFEIDSIAMSQRLNDIESQLKALKAGR